MKNLLRLSKVNQTPNFPLRAATLYKMHHLGRFPGLFVKIGSALFVDLDVFDKIIEQGRSK